MRVCIALDSAEGDSFLYENCVVLCYVIGLHVE
jgi:hypothetical protein